MIDMAHALVVEGCDPLQREAIEERFEPLGHEIRVKYDEEYKKATWGRRPEDIAQTNELLNVLAGRDR